MAGPLAGPAVCREGLAARVGLAAAFWFSAKLFTMCFPPNRLTRKTPTLHLPWRRPRTEKGRRPDTQAGQRNEGEEETREKRKKKIKQKKDKTEKRKKRKKKRAKGETPTLEPGRRGQRPDQLFF